MPENIFETHIIKDSALPFIFHCININKSREAFANWHTNIEILYCTYGSGEVVLDGSPVSLSPGEMVVVNSQILHYVRTDSFINYFCLIADKDFCRSNGILSDSVYFSPHIKDSECASAFDDVVEAYKISDERGRVPVIRARILFLIALLYKNYSADSSPDFHEGGCSLERAKQTVLYIKQHFSESITLSQIASELGVSKYYMSREFKKYLGMTIFEYLNLVRCKEAQRLINGGISVSSAAMSCGFENMSYFSRSYKKYMGTLPSGRSIKSKTPINK